MAEESLYSKDWFLKAMQDAKRVEILLNANDLEGAAFHLQQAIEKYLKGYLLSRGWKLKRTHNLVELLKDALAYDKSLENFRGICEQITEYYVEERYPFLVSSKFEKEEIKTVFEKAKKLIRSLRIE